MVRAATMEDAAGVVAVGTVVYPEFVSSADGFRHMIATTPAAARAARWCAEANGEIVAWASASRVLETSAARVAALQCTVHPEHRRRGIGAALYDLAEAHVRSIGARRLSVWSRSDEESASFLRSRGFEQTRSSEILVLDPRGVAEPEAPPGVELLPFSAFADDPTPLHRLDAATTRDMPNDFPLDTFPYDVWVERVWRHPLTDRDASMTAVMDGEVVAYAVLWTDRPSGRALNNGTGTLRAYRGRGLATLVKQASLARAAALGITSVYTGNDTTNAPMLAINRRLGYRSFSVELTWAKEIAAS